MTAEAETKNPTVKKCVVTSPSWEDFIAALGGAQSAKFMLETGLDIHYEEQTFSDKKAYEGLVIAQRAVVIIDRTRKLVAIVIRSDFDQHGLRKTTGQSVLLSGSAMMTAGEVLTAKIKGGNVKEDERGKVVLAVNESSAGKYVFITHRAFVDSSQGIEGQGADTKVSWRTFEDALTALGSDKAMECAILRLMIADLEAAA